MGDAAPSMKRRQVEQLVKDAEDDENEGDVDPGDWKPANSDATKGRRKVHARRTGGQVLATAEPAAAGEAPAQQAAIANPFAGIVLAPPAGAPFTAAGATNPFAGISLVAPVQEATAGEQTSSENGNKGADEPATEAQGQTQPKADADATASGSKGEDPRPSTTTMSAGGFGALATGGAGGINPFASLGSKPFEGFGSMGGGFGALGAAGTGGAFGGFGAAGGAGGFGGSTFSFGTGAFPPVAAAPLPGGTSGGGAAAAGAPEGGAAEDEGGEGKEQDEGGNVALFGNSAVQPVVSLPEQEKRTGEEQEEVVFAADGVLYEFDTTASKWRERGKGEFKVNKTAAAADEPQATQHARMVMRQAANLRLLLNAKVYAGMPVALMHGNVGVTFGVVNAAAGTGAEPAAGSNSVKSAGLGEDAAATHPAESAPSAAIAADTSAAAAATTPGGHDGGGKVKPTTWAVRMKSADKVQVLHDLLQRLRQGSPNAAEPTV